MNKYKAFGLLVILYLYVLLPSSHSFIADEFEDDNFYYDAVYFVVNSEDQHPQLHSFHDNQDVDWIMFHAISGTSYKVSTSNLGENCDIAIKIYDTDGVTLIAERDKFGTGIGETIEINFKKHGLYHIKLNNFYSNNTGENTQYFFYIEQTTGDLLGNIIGYVINIDTNIGIEAVSVSIGNRTVKSLNGIFNSVFYKSLYGMYRINDHEKGTYQLTAEHEHFKRTNVDVNVAQGETTIKDLYLHPILIDVDKNGEFDIKDVVIALKTLAGFELSDVHKDNVQFSDILIIFKYLCFQNLNE